MSDGDHDFTGDGKNTICSVCGTFRRGGVRPSIELECDEVMREKSPVRYLELKFSRACQRAAESLPVGSDGRRAFEELAKEILQR